MSHATSMMGKSRSATLVIAYLLSRDPSLTPQTALESLRTVREFAEPNDGFMQQLELYHSMGCPVDVLVEPKYQRWLYRREVDMSVACGRAPDHIRFEDEARSEAATVSTGSSESPRLEFRCRRCRQKLGTSEFMVPHTPKPPSATQASQIATLDEGSTSGPSASTQCAHIFLDPLSWMRQELEQGQLEGKLNCPNQRCKATVGKYAWQGQRCSCGQWILPALSLARGRVDEMRSVALLERRGKM
jgi:dual specificity phosphatase 12